MSDDDILPEEDELMDRCLEFTSLVTQRSAKVPRDALFNFIMITSASRAEQELKTNGYTKYPLIGEIAPAKRLKGMKAVYSVEQEKYVNKILEALKDKSAVTMAGSRYA